MTKLFEIHHQGAMTGKTTGSSSVPRCVPQATLEQVLLPRQVRTSATLAPSHNCLLSWKLAGTTSACGNATAEAREAPCPVAFLGCRLWV